MSGDWISVLGDDGRMRRVIDAPDLCGEGHPTVVVQMGSCPDCYATTVVFWCSTSGCRWRIAGGRHRQYDCQPGTRRPPGDTFGVKRS